ncbi:class I SAM-dependent methyltransferase [Sorangium cellulosum]|nr:class I SAM-dependent methyltransferase [Sorangium cellulosum]
MFDSLYRESPLRAALMRLLPEALAAEEIVSTASTGFLTAEVLARFELWLGMSLGLLPPSTLGPARLLDLGCGVGRVGRRLAAALGVRLVGLDCSNAAITEARVGVAHLMDHERPQFHVADFSSTGLPEASVSAALSLDALYLAPDPLVALAELHRIMVPSGTLVMTAYVSENQYAGTTNLLGDWRPILSSAGFSVDRYDNQSAIWRDVMRSKHERRWAARATLRSEFGWHAEAELSVSAAMLGIGGRPSFLTQVERFEISAHRRP